jgi:chromate reductase
MSTRSPSKRSRPTLLLLNAALGGAAGNTAELIAVARRALRGRAELDELALDETFSLAAIHPRLDAADAFIFATGTYWDSWSHTLQRFLEEATPTEGTSTWLGKPAGVLVTMHAVGGKGVLSRLQGVLNTLGCLIPPHGGVVFSLANQQALKGASPLGKDLWRPEDVKIVCHNVLASISARGGFRSWPVERSEYASKWIEKK